MLLACRFVAVIVFYVVYYLLKGSDSISVLPADRLQRLHNLIPAPLEQIKIAVVLFALLLNHRTFYVPFDLLLAHLFPTVVSRVLWVFEFQVADPWQAVVYLDSALHFGI